MGGRGSSSKRTGYTTPLKLKPDTEEPEAKPEEPTTTEPEEPDKQTYHFFRDKALDGWNYEGDGHHQKEWFKKNSNFEELAKEIENDYSLSSTFENWASGYFMRGQQYNGWDRMSDNEKHMTQAMDDIIDRSTLNKGVQVVRLASAELVLGKGHTSASLADLQAMEGSIVTSKGSMSTGAAAQGLTIGDYWGNKKVEYSFRIPSGSTGAGMWIGDSRINPYWGAKQREFIINRDTSFRVGKTTYDSARDVYVVQMQYVGLGDHDYGKTGRV